MQPSVHTYCTSDQVSLIYNKKRKDYSNNNNNKKKEKKSYEYQADACHTAVVVVFVVVHFKSAMPLQVISTGSLLSTAQQVVLYQKSFLSSFFTCLVFYQCLLLTFKKKVKNTNNKFYICYSNQFLLLEELL